MESFDTDTLLWAGIFFCISQSAMFSGLNLAFFSLSRLQLQVEISHGNKAAEKVLAVRQDSNFLLTTILWGNVGINVLLTLLSDSVLAGFPGLRVFHRVYHYFRGDTAAGLFFAQCAAHGILAGTAAQVLPVDPVSGGAALRAGAGQVVGQGRYRLSP
jgi:CBS domain containing-hemolysin-like protein